MIRVAVIAYLSLTTVVGPSLCCCNARQLFVVVEKSGKHCCGKPSKSATTFAHGHSHKHHHRREQVADQSESPTHVERSPQTPCDRDDKNCPCGNRQAKLVATAAGAGMNAQTVELQSRFFNHLAADLSVLPEFNLKEASTRAHVRPADLFGREMLRAYQILRC